MLRDQRCRRGKIMLIKKAMVEPWLWLFLVLFNVEIAVAIIPVEFYGFDSVAHSQLISRGV